jgi:putative endonuclease
MNSGLAKFIAALLSRWGNHFSRSKDSSPPEHALGARGEKLAAKFLRRNGYKVLYRDFKPRRGGQIDIVCRDDDTLVFVEVKSRRDEVYQRPVDGIHADQKRSISRGALTWLRMLDNPDIPFRFDVVEVIASDDGTKPRLELIQNAFQLAKPYMY